MSRVADATIKGFIYQFYKSIEEILKSSSDEVITLEGVIEDIDIEGDDGLKAVQCKYHEGVDKLTNSNIYKPIAQMIARYNANPEENISYHLYAYFPNEESGENTTIDSNFIGALFNSADTQIVKILKEVEQETLNKEDFLSKLKFEIGLKMEELEQSIITLFENESFKKTEIEEVIFPKALEVVGRMSYNKVEENRKITKQELIKLLKATKNAVMPIWALELKSYQQILSKIRKQNDTNLKSNTRKRAFIFSPDETDHFMDDIINFIKEYTEKYFFKPLHIHPPLFCFITSDMKLNLIKERLAQKDIRFEDGIAGTKFIESWFYKKPILGHKENEVQQHEFKLRILDSRYLKSLNRNKPDDFFLIGKIDTNTYELDGSDTNISTISVKNISELEYVFYLRSTNE